MGRGFLPVQDAALRGRSEGENAVTVGFVLILLRYVVTSTVILSAHGSSSKLLLWYMK